MDDERVAIGPVKPGQDEELVSGLDALEPLDDVGLEDQPRIGRALVALLGRRLRVRERRGDPADCPDVESQRYGRVSQSMSGWA